MKLNRFNLKTTKSMKCKHKVKNQTMRRKKSKCLLKTHQKSIRSIRNSKTSFKIEDIGKDHLIMEIEITKDPVPDKISRIRTGMLGKITNSICRICTPCTTTKWCNSTIPVIKQTQPRSPQCLHLLSVNLQTSFQEMHHQLLCKEINQDRILSFHLKILTKIRILIKTKTKEITTQTQEDETTNQKIQDFLYTLFMKSFF